MDAEAWLAEIDAETLDPEPLHGLDYRKRIVYDPSADWMRQREELGVMATCEWCGGQWKVHPMHADQVHTCSRRCRYAAFRARKKGEMQREVRDMPWQPWTHHKEREAAS